MEVVLARAFRARLSLFQKDNHSLGSNVGFGLELRDGSSAFVTNSGNESEA